MQHDIIELVDALEFARKNFEHTTDSKARYRFSRENKLDAFSQPYREDIAVFDIVQVHGEVRGTQVKITVIGLGDNVQYQREEIARVLKTYQRGQN